MKERYLDISGFKEKEFAVFCGAGISRNSGLPLANELKQYILEKLSIDNEDIEEIMNSNLPLEAFIETILETTDISEILDMFGKGEPNANHILIARLAKNGYIRTIFTTNFDLLIEKALENEGLKRGEDFQVYSDEEQFSAIDFENIENGIRIFKIHGSVDNRDSIRATMKAVASKTLSDKRMNVIRYLFSAGNHKRVLILGYSCSDEFDITPQIRSIEENQKDIILVEHSEHDEEEIEDIRIKGHKNPFKKFSGKRIRCNTNDFIEDLWDSFGDMAGGYTPIESKIEWKAYLDDWINESDENSALKYNTAGRIFCNNIANFKKAIKYFEKSLEISKEIGDKARESRSYMGLGSAYHGLGNLKKAIEYYEESLEFYKEVEDKMIESRCYTNLGAAYYSLGDFKRTNEYHKASLQIAEETGDKTAQSVCYMSLGNASRSLGDLKKAIEFYDKSLAISKDIGYKIGESRCYTNLGAVYHYAGDFERAIEYYERSLQIAKGIGDGVGESGCYTSLASAYHGLGNFKKAIEYYEKSLEFCKEVGDKIGESRCYVGLGAVYHSLGDFKEAIQCYQTALQIAKEIESKVEESTCHMNLGVACYSSGDFKQAIEYFLKAEKIFMETRQIHYLEVLYKNLSLAYDKLGDNENAENYKRKLSRP